MLKNNIPKLELGFMRHDTLNKDKSQEIVDYAIVHGQPYFEACYFYLNEECESFIYSLLEKYKREEYYICDKLPVHGIVENSNIDTIFTKQLDKIPGNYFDMYLLQALDETCDWILYEQKIIPYLLQKKKEGKIKRLGISIQCTPKELERYLKLGCWDIVQMPLNYYDWFLCMGKELYEIVKKYNLPIIAQAPMKGGLLKNISVDNPTKVAIDFIKQLDNIEMILTGCSTLESYKNTLSNLEDKNDRQIDLSYWQDLIYNFSKTQTISCINCNKCSRVCPINLPIRAYFKMYNEVMKDPENSKQYFLSLNALKKTTDEPCNRCIQCGRCEEVCLQHLPIRQLLLDKIFELRT